MLRECRVYLVLREAHWRLEGEGFREVVDRVLQVLMADEDPYDLDLDARVLEMEESEDDGSVTV